MEPQNIQPVEPQNIQHVEQQNIQPVEPQNIQHVELSSSSLPILNQNDIIVRNDGFSY